MPITVPFPPDGLWSTDPIARRSGGTYLYYQTDHLGTPRQLIDNTGTVVHTREQRAFGQIAHTGLEDRLRFPGQLYSQETGLHYNYFRDYAPGLGRFLQIDPLGALEDPALYSFPKQNPLIVLDPLGLFCIPLRPKLSGWETFREGTKGDWRLNRFYTHAGSFGFGICELIRFWTVTERRRKIMRSFCRDCASVPDPCFGEREKCKWSVRERGREVERREREVYELDWIPGVATANRNNPREAGCIACRTERNVWRNTCG